MNENHPKNRALAVVLALFFGGIGIHRFYLDQVKSGLMFALFSWTFIPSIIAVIDAIRLAFMPDSKFQKRYSA